VVASKAMINCWRIAEGSYDLREERQEGRLARWGERLLGKPAGDATEVQGGGGQDMVQSGLDAVLRVPS
jgi:hypothetical protein